MPPFGGGGRLSRGLRRGGADADRSHRGPRFGVVRSHRASELPVSSVELGIARGGYVRRGGHGGTVEWREVPCTGEAHLRSAVRARDDGRVLAARVSEATLGAAQERFELHDARSRVRLQERDW